ncbi:glycosyltransferase family 2 protein [Billgrantia sp. LNSP4103-1]|uniref:glycosyltransferase family 2 protein n=1 Tax=Billgrantia sp. LNSP4103-1 TaxID=3410266 RepID=UPI00403F7FA4
MSGQSTTNTISIVIPTHNRPDGLRHSLQSIINQTLLPNEIIVVDDGSVPAVNKAIFQDFPESVNCTLLRNEKPRGGNNARNQGVIAATGSFIAFLDDDDEFKPCKIERIISMLSNQSPDLITSFATVSLENKYFYTIRPPAECNYEEQLIKNKTGMTSMVCVRKESFIYAGMFDEELEARQDYEAWLRMLKKGFTYSCIETDLVQINMSFCSASVSKSIENNIAAVSLIDKKYYGDISMLNEDQKKERSAAFSTFFAHKYMMNGLNFKAFRVLLSSFMRYRQFKFLFAAFFSMLGRKAFFFIFSKVNK